MQTFSYLHSLGVFKSLLACWAFNVLSYITFSLLGLKLRPMRVLGKCSTDLHSQLPLCCLAFLDRVHWIAQAGSTFNSPAQTPNYRHNYHTQTFIYSFLLGFCRFVLLIFEKRSYLLQP